MAWACIALMGVLAAGCRIREPPSPDRSRPARRVIYESQGTITALQTFGTECSDRAFVAEWVYEDSKRCRFSVIEIASGEATVVYEESWGPILLQDELGLAGDGRIALVVGQPDADASSQGSTVGIADVMGEDEAWYALTPFDERFTQQWLQWSPTGDALAYWRITGWFEAYDGVVAWVPPRDLQDTETVVASAASLADRLLWSADGRQLYHVRRGEEETALRAISWPSLETSEVVTAERIEPCGVARQTGDSVFLMPAQRTADVEPHQIDAPVLAWRMSQDALLTRIAACLPEWPAEAAVSPDGTCLAVIPEQDSEAESEAEIAGVPPSAAASLLVYSLDDGPVTSIPGFEGKDLEYLAWVLDGVGLVFVEDRERVWLVPVGAAQ